MDQYAGTGLVRYMGSRHSAVGFLLAILGLFALSMGAFALSASDVFTPWIAGLTFAWGMVALPLGISMRRKQPIRTLWVLANLLLGVGMLALYGFVLFGR